MSYRNDWTPGQLVQIAMLSLTIIGGSYAFFGQIEANGRGVSENGRDIARLESDIANIQKETINGDKRLTRIEDKIDLVIDRLAPARTK